jgi:hypothetical protein
MDGIGSGQPAGRDGRRDQGRADPGAQQATQPEAEVLAMSETTPALPVATGGYEQARFNALRHGVLSRYTMLPWEDAAEYGAVLDAPAAEHGPRGPTEEHLVEEIAGILWRKRRLRLAEAAAIRGGLPDLTFPSCCRRTAEKAVAHLRASATEVELAEAVQATPEDTASDLADLATDEAQTLQAIAILQARGKGAYKQAMAALHEDTVERWHDVLERDGAEEVFSPNAAGLLRFLEEKVRPWYDEKREEVERRPLLRSQALGEAFGPRQLEGVARYEVHLDRKLERMLAMLLKLKELRGPAEPA